MRLKVLCSSVAIWAALTGGVFAAQDVSVEQWLQRLQEAQSTQSYQGAFVYERKGTFSTHEMTRFSSSTGQLTEHFLQLNGPAHEVVRTNGQVTCISAAIADKVNSIEVWPTHNIALDPLHQWYDVIVLGETRTAGRTTAVLLFSPNDQHRYPVELYLDQATAVPLRSLLLNERGQLLERFQFVQFQPLPADSEQKRGNTASINCLPVNTQQELTDPEWAATAMGRADLNVSWVPPGFVLQRSNYRPSVDNDGYVLSQVYSDGLAHFSVFYEKIHNLEIEG